MERKRSLIRRATAGFFWNQLSKVVVFGLSLLFSVVVARGLGASRYGIYASVLTVASLFRLLGSLGFNQVANTYIPKFLGEGPKTAYLIRRLFFIRTSIIFLLAFVLYTSSGSISELMHIPELSLYVKLVSLYVIFSSISEFLLHVFIGQLRIGLTFLSFPVLYMPLS